MASFQTGFGKGWGMGCAPSTPVTRVEANPEGATLTRTEPGKPAEVRRVTSSSRADAAGSSGTSFCAPGEVPQVAVDAEQDPHREGWLAGKWAASTDDRERVDALRRLGILLSAREPAFDRLTQLGSALFSAPICLISFVDEEEQWFKAAVGLDAPSTSRDMAFCTYTTLRETNGVFVVLDARADQRFVANPLVAGPPNIAFYAGAPIFHPNTRHKLGSFCVIDSKPRTAFDERQKLLLLTFAQHVTHELVSRATAMANRSKTQTLMTMANEMRETQRSLETSVANYRNLIEAANAPIFAVKNAHLLPVTIWNRRMEQITGIRADAAIGRPIVDVFEFASSNSSSERQKLILAIRAALEAQRLRGAQRDVGLADVGQAHLARPRPAADPAIAAAPVPVTESVVSSPAVDIEIVTSHSAVDSPTHLQLAMTPIVQDGDRTTGVVCICEDVSERLRREGEHMRAVALERADQAKSAFLASLSHEMRTPLNGMIGMLELALNDPGLRQTRSARFVKQAWTSSRLLLNLISDTHDIARIEAGQLVLEEEIFTPLEVADVAVGVVAADARKKHLRLAIKMDPHVRTQCCVGDTHRIARVLINLLYNRCAGSLVAIAVRGSLTGGGPTAHCQLPVVRFAASSSRVRGPSRCVPSCSALKTAVTLLGTAAATGARRARPPRRWLTRSPAEPTTARRAASISSWPSRWRTRAAA